MRAFVLFLAATLCPLSAAHGQVPSSAPEAAPVARVWASGQPGPLPVRVEFFRSSSRSPLDSVAVFEATKAALLASGLPPDVEVVRHLRPGPSGRHLRVEVNSYQAGEVRLEAVFIEESGEEQRACRGESQWGIRDPLASALHLSHRLHALVECVKREHDIP